MALRAQWGFLASALSLLLFANGCSPQLSVSGSVQKPDGSGTDAPPTLADWTECPDDSLPSAPTGPQRISKVAYLNYLYEFLSIGSRMNPIGGFAIPGYMGPTSPSHSPASVYWGGFGLADLFAIPEDVEPKKFYTTNHALTASHVDAYLTAAHSVASLIQDSPSNLANMIGPCNTLANNLPCMRNFLERAMRALFVRLPVPGEVERYLARFNAASGSTGEKWGVVIRALLMHPDFLFINPYRGSIISSSPMVIQLTPFELARKISYALTAGPPNDALWNAAVSGNLGSDPTVLAAQVQELMTPDQSSTNPGGQHDSTQHQVNKFYKDYLWADDISSEAFFEPDKKAAEAPRTIHMFNLNYTDQLQQENYGFFYSKFWGDAKYADMFLDERVQFNYSRYKTSTQPGIPPYPNCPAGTQTLNTLPCPIGSACDCFSLDWAPGASVRAYGALELHPVTPSEFGMTSKVVTVSLPERQGILTRHMFAHNTASRFYPNVIHSGQKAKSIFACDPTPTPNFALLASGFRNLVPRHERPDLSTADWIKNTTSSAACMSCHHGGSGMESWGKLWGDFDGFNRLNTGGTERVFDSSGLNGTPTYSTATEINLDEKPLALSSVYELGAALSESRQSQVCFARTVFSFLEGRVATPEDSCSLKRMSAVVAVKSMKEVFKEYFNHPNFRTRRAL